MKTRQLWFLTIVFTITSVISVSAQTSNFTYQGRLTNAGATATGNYDFEFGLFETVDEEVSLYPTVTRTNVPVTNGIFTVEIDFGVVVPVEAFLEIRVKQSGGAEFTTLTPRQKITTAPYANRAAFSIFALSTNNANFANTAANANNLGGFPATDFARTNFSNTFTANQIFNGNITQTGDTRINSTDGFVVKGTGGAGTIPATGAGTRMMFYPAKYAFRVGSVSFGQWDEVNIGSGSAAFGFDTIARGQASFAAGDGSLSEGFNSAAFNQARATGMNSFATGNSITEGFNSVAMGSQNQANGVASIALGLLNFTTNGATGSVALGSGSKVFHSGTFSFADNTGLGLESVANNSWTTRASGGYRLFSNANMTTGVQLSAGGGSWTSLSDRNVKDNITTVDSHDIFRKVLNLPISNWSYKGQDFRHIGPMAQDFYSIFNVGENDKTITTVDPDGIALAAIQGLNQELQDQLKTRDTQINNLQNQVKALKQLVCANQLQAEICRQ